MHEITMLRAVRDRYTDLLWQGCVLEFIKVEETQTGSALCIDYVTDDGDKGYCWPDINYEDQSRHSWRAAEHLIRLLRLLCRDGRERLHTDASYRERVIGLVRHWVRMDYQNPNWWHVVIGMPNHMTILALMLRDVLPPDVWAGAVELGARGSMKTNAGIVNWTGANLIWGVGNTIRHALLTEDVELLAVASERAQQEITVGHTEGIQTDGSFCQHGPRWYSGGYGGSYIFDLSQFVYALAGTPWAVSRERLDILLTHVLDGQRHMMHHGYFDYNGVGRELTRRGTLHTKHIHYAADLLARTDGIPRQEELAAFVAQNQGGATVSGPVPYAETRYYPAVSYLAHNAEGIHIGIKCHAPGQYDMELCNSEGVLCYNMSYGTRTCHMRRGDEYVDINPIFDYAHLPGTTARLETDDELRAHVGWVSLPLPTNHTIGLTEWDYGIVSELAEHDGIGVTAAYFTFGGRMIALGTTITDEHPERGALTTTIEQCRVLNPTLPAEGDCVASNGGFSYINLDPTTPLIAEVTERVGSWQRNSLEETYGEIRGQLFLAYLPVSGQDGTYAYAVCPRGKAVGARIVRNDADCQAILTDSGMLMAVFHTETTLTCEDAVCHAPADSCRILCIRS